MISINEFNKTKNDFKSISEALDNLLNCSNELTNIVNCNECAYDYNESFIDSLTQNTKQYINNLQINTK